MKNLLKNKLLLLLMSLLLMNSFYSCSTTKKVQKQEADELTKIYPRYEEEIELKKEDSSYTIILACGDVMLANHLEPILKTKGYDYPYQHTKTYIQDADLAIANLECPVTSLEGKKKKRKQFTFKSRPEALQGLANAGFDVCNVANNHSMDFGRLAFYDTISNIHKFGMLHTGGGRNLEQANRPTFITNNSLKIGILGFYLLGYNSPMHATQKYGGTGTAHEGNVVERVSKWTNQCDILIVCYHWGKEYSRTPAPYQTRIAHLCIDAGADMVIGHHPHVPQPVELYKNKPILYSLGNYVFASYGKPWKKRLSDDSFLAMAYFIRDRFSHLRLIPLDVYNYRVNFAPQPMTPEKGRAMLERLQTNASNLNMPLYITPEGHGLIHAVREANP